MTDSPTSSPESQAQKNVAIWKRVEMTDASATKKFTRGGGFSGTAINPTYQYEVITALFGPCGQGWGFDIVEEKLVEGHARKVFDEKGAEIGNDRTVIHQLRISFWYVWNDAVHHIPSIGVTTMIGSNKNGPFTDEEAPKKSLTDALTGALQKLGVSADIFRGYYDDNKYVAWRMQEEAAGRGTTAVVGSPPQLPATATKLLDTPKDDGQAAKLAAIEAAHVAWADEHRRKIDNVTKDQGWPALGPLLDEVATRTDMPESLKVMLRAAAHAKVSLLGPRPKAAANAS